MIQPIRRFLLDRMVLRPSRHSIDFAPKQRVTLRSGGRPLECFVEQNFDQDRPPDLLVLKFPGTAGRAERSTSFPMAMLGEVRVRVWTWNPPGYGRSGGRATLPGIADAALDYWSQACDLDRGAETCVWLCGNSLGSVSVLHVAASMSPDPKRSGIILRNPPPLLPVVKRIARRYPLGQFADPIVHSLDDSMNAMSTAPRVNLPAVFFQSELDSLVPASDQSQLIEAYAGTSQVVVMDGLEHGDLATEGHQIQIQRSINWLWRQNRCASDEPSPTS